MIIKNRFEGIVRVLVTMFVIGTLFAWGLLVAAIPVEAQSISSSSSYFDRGIQQILAQNFKEAIALFTESIYSKVNIPAAHANRCLAYLQLHEYDLALADCTIAINSPNNSESFLNRGLAYYNLGKYSPAIADFDQVLTTNNSDFRAYYNRGLAKFALNHLPEAIADYGLALNVIDHNLPEIQSEIYNERGLTYFFLRDLDLALINYSLAILTNPQSDRAYFNRGCTYQRKRNYSLAAQDFSSAIAINSHSPEALMNRAIALRQLGKKSQAITDLNRAAQEFLAQGLIDDYIYALDLAKQLGDRDSFAVV